MRTSTWLWVVAALSASALFVGACEDSDTTTPTSGAGGTCTNCTGGNGGDGAGATGAGPGVGGSSNGGTGGNPSTGGAGGTGTGGDGGDGGSGGGGVVTACYAGLGCNPLVGTMCAAAGSACDTNGTATFECFAGPNPQTVGQACDSLTCAHGLTCVEDVCREYCCPGDDTPCSTGTCQNHPTAGPGSGAPIEISVCLP